MYFQLSFVPIISIFDFAFSIRVPDWWLISYILLVFQASFLPVCRFPCRFPGKRTIWIWRPITGRGYSDSVQPSWTQWTLRGCVFHTLTLSQKPTMKLVWRNSDEQGNSATGAVRVVTRQGSSVQDNYFWICFKRMNERKKEDPRLFILVNLCAWIYKYSERTHRLF